MPGSQVQLVQPDATGRLDVPVDMASMVAAAVAQQSSGSSTATSAAQSATALTSMVGSSGQQTVTAADSTAARTLLAANPNRKGVPGIYFDGAAILYVALGGTGVTPGPGNFAVKLGQGLLTYWEPPVGTYTGAVRGTLSATVASTFISAAEVV